MIFSSFTFFIFFTAVMSLLIAFKNQKARKWVLLLSSYFFYGYWDYRLLSLIIFSAAFNYAIGSKMAATENAVERRRFLAVGLLINLGLLGFFKYYNFFITSANLAFGNLGFNLSTLNIILPIGISFYTFHALNYVIDIYRREIKPAKSFFNFALFIGFFPQLIAGPIVRASFFLPQLEKDILIKKDNIKIGLQIFILGLIKKVLIADKIAYFVDYVFANPALYGSATIWLAVVAYSIQIYCDFSGYSDMAIGLAKMMGFSLPVNFNIPYSSTSLVEFWKRWHISLSSWLRDYLYIPLGGNKKGRARTYINLFITMLLGGLWHGASWNFVFWGFWHGLGLAINKIFRVNIKLEKNFITLAASWALTYGFVLIGWVFFRSQNFSDSIIILKKMFMPSGGIPWMYTYALAVIPLVFAAHVFRKRREEEEYTIFNLNTFRSAFILIFVLLGFFFLSSMKPSPFIYFQF